MKNILILGSTGSIGKQTIEVINENPDKFNLLGIVGNTSVNDLLEQSKITSVKYVGTSNKETYKVLKENLNNIEVFFGIEEISSMCEIDEIDIVVNSLVGTIGVIPTKKALLSKKRVALANKETLVTAGAQIMKLAFDNDTEILPIDSEHSAIMQCLLGNEDKKVEKIILTASGGPFRGYSVEQLEKVTLSQALNHPNWSMGKKITIDSATLMNKGLEYIEAKHLFGDIDIDVIIQKESIIHSMVMYYDGSIIAQMDKTNMKAPIGYALNYPDRLQNHYNRLDFNTLGSLNFMKYDEIAFPCLKYAIDAYNMGSSYPAVLNAANEMLVYEFLKGKIRFMDIPRKVEYALNKHNPLKDPSLEDLIELDKMIKNNFNKEVI